MLAVGCAVCVVQRPLKIARHPLSMALYVCRWSLHVRDFWTELVPIDDVNGFVVLLLSLAPELTVFPTNCQRVVCLSPVL
jgi:hypothetical protein